MAIGTKCRANSHNQSNLLQPHQGIATTPSYRPVTNITDKFSVTDKFS